jgi:serine/threonine-protein kinase
VTSRGLSFGTEDLLRAEFRGPLRAGRLVPVVHGIVVERRTGVLHLHDGAKRKKIYFVEGAPEYVASTEKKELLGEHLVARGQVLRMEVDMALAMLPRFGGRIGDALVGLGVLRPIELFRAIHEQTQDRFLEVFHWTKGEIGFVRGARSQEEMFPHGVDPYLLLARGVRDGYEAEEIEAILAPIGETLLEPVVLPPVRVEAFRLSDRELKLLRSIDGTLTLHRVMAQNPTHLGDVLKAVFMGLSFQMLRANGF